MPAYNLFIISASSAGVTQKEGRENETMCRPVVFEFVDCYFLSVEAGREDEKFFTYLGSINRVSSGC